MSYKRARLRRLNDRRARSQGEYVLYWMQIFRRLECNHALDYALRCADELNQPLVIYEGLRLDYPWASRRFHQFILEGMRANAEQAEKIGFNYWPSVETARGEGRGLLRRLSERACLVVTDDYPCFIVPGQSRALAEKADVPVIAVDSNSLVPLSLLGPPVFAAAHLRPRIHKAFAEAWPHRATKRPRGRAVARQPVKAPFDFWRAGDVAAFVDGLPLDGSVPSVDGTPGSPPAARRRKVFGRIRYMSSENTARKFDIKPYYAYVEGLPTIEGVRSGRGLLRSFA